MEKTLSIIKPDATKRNLTGKINKLIEESDIKIIAQKMIILSDKIARDFYSIHADKPFFNDLIQYMTSGTVIVQVLQANDVVNKYRVLMGATNPDKANDGTIRKLVALNVQENSVHGSDSIENAKKEIDFFFDESQIF